VVTSEDIIGRPYTSYADLTTLDNTATTATATTAATGETGAVAAESVPPAREIRSIQGRHFEAAFSKVRASVATKDRKR
jgi:hypothetical protein